MKKTIVIFCFSIFISVLSFSQNTEIWIKNSPEIRLEIKNTPIDIRWRPFEQMIMPDHYFGKHSLIRNDLMLGVTIWKFKIFSYSKYDEFHRFWTGIRLDLNLDFFDKKLLVNLQGRYFWGLNEDSDDHYYFIQYPRYRISKNIFLGALGYGTWDKGVKFNEGEWFIGPSVEFKLPYNFSIHTAMTYQIFSDINIFMWFIRLNYKIKLDLSSKKVEE